MFLNCPPQDQDLLSPGIIVNSGHGSASSTLEGSRHLSRSNIDIPRAGAGDDTKRQLPRKRSDSSTYELDTIKQHQAFLSRCVGKNSYLGEKKKRTQSWFYVRFIFHMRTDFVLSFQLTLQCLAERRSLTQVKQQHYAGWRLRGEV